MGMSSDEESISDSDSVPSLVDSGYHPAVDTPQLDISLPSDLMEHDLDTSDLDTSDLPADWGDEYVYDDDDDDYDGFYSDVCDGVDDEDAQHGIEAEIQDEVKDGDHDDHDDSENDHEDQDD